MKKNSNCIGDNSGSHSEDYVLNVFQTQPDGSEKRIYTLRSGGFGLYQEETKSFPRDKTYTFQIDWQGTTNQSTGPQSNPEGADFDYDFIVEPISGHESHTLIDAYDPKTKSVDTSQSLRGNRNNITEFLTTHEPKRVLRQCPDFFANSVLVYDANLAWTWIVKCFLFWRLEGAPKSPFLHKSRHFGKMWAVCGVISF